MPRLIVYIAEALTPCSDGTHSITGHAFYGFDYGNGLIETYGLHPSKDGENGVAGTIKTKD
ncbi:hypothetical protein SOV_23860 [Sporomusa ovata DSM 2662]|uniref:Uncharacterized protein n=1 Tax=Sporomusa ovata TaxID=2378 RepID=A0A0U1L4M1_9FIRM|nr:hypothetical protein [Sporomusa ovata]EQB25702.1 hypothetical protein SOV_4c03650 [Sporomusa ovata DSM 2662]CQR74259.1 hypothetical protein SpAn4DRAFT_0721 [Sporomusa ovata]